MLKFRSSNNALSIRNKMSAIQLLLFPETEEDRLRRKVFELEAANDKMKLSMDKQRKALFARNGELGKIVKDLGERLEIIERNICQNR